MFGRCSALSGIRLKTDIKAQDVCVLQSVPVLGLVQEHEKVNGTMSANKLITSDLKYAM